MLLDVDIQEHGLSFYRMPCCGPFGMCPEGYSSSEAAHRRVFQVVRKLNPIWLSPANFIFGHVVLKPLPGSQQD